MAKVERLWSLDAYRGLIMLTLAADGFGLRHLARKFLEQNPDHVAWRLVAFHTDHPDWVSNRWLAGCSYWDLIQPSFMFMVGVAMPYSYGKRLDSGQSTTSMTLHALFRSVVLILLGVFLSSAGAQKPKMTDWTFVNVLTQIGLGYMGLYLLQAVRPIWQVASALAILAITWVAFVLYPVPESAGLVDHFQRDVNIAARFDTWFLNLFPRSEEFKVNRGGYATLNFVPSMATMIFGLLAGQVLRGQRHPWAKVGILLCAGLACLGSGLLLGETVCPIVKKIWTPSWVLFSAGYTFTILAVLYLVLDVLGGKLIGYPLVVLGTNSILLYVMGQLMRSWTATQLQIHFGWSIFDGTYGPVIRASGVMLVFWLICLWLHRQKLFVRI